MKSSAHSEVSVGQVGQVTPLTLVQGDVAKQVAPFETVNHVTHAVGLLVQIRRVNLANISGENDFGVFLQRG